MSAFSRFTLRALFLTAVLTASAAPSATALNDPPIIRPDTLRRVAPGVSVILDPRINYVPNIGIIEGTKAILVVDTGMGPENGRRVYDEARKVARGRRIYLTTTHFHPEHSFGASAFPAGSLIQNQAQVDELAEKGKPYLELFRSFGKVERAALENVTFIRAGITYRGSKWLDLGGRKVLLKEMPAHTRGDQIIFVPSSGVIFTGDLIEDRFFPIMPDGDARGSAWIAVAQRILALHPKVVVPGHGNIGDARMVRHIQAYLEHVRSVVNAGVAAGKTQEAITSELTPQLKTLHPNWDNAIFIPYEIAVFFSERTGQPPIFPKLGADLQSDKK